MPFTQADLLAAAQRSLAAAEAHDRDGWIGLFTADGRVEDPVGSMPHRGREAIAKFYDTFIAPRSISFSAESDLVVATTVVRDVLLEIGMASTLTMRVPTYIRYDISTGAGSDGAAEGDELKIAALSAYWELPAMVGQFVRGGLGAIPAGTSLGRAMVANQGMSGSLGFLTGFRGSGTGRRELFTRFLDAACGGDELGLRRHTADTAITRGDTEPLTTSELARQLSGGTWDKLIRSGRSVAARVERGGRRCVLIAETSRRRGQNRAVLSRLRLFGELW
ncbi:NTF2 domain-containing protein [Mycolicibacterium chubuense NBB4]|uniref:NTF2 domain-containing protein n=1 Tax=Mycolicibacterium chubuense (strain NBB4) TaxID=710421 RepID=I4BJM9_MYCCN|nr:ketosteroid isomerase family protein [Mycolicibacterium chubuense]AFM17486.1 NTF2 domain-containing protein [Mycolicibacterium chubuense NBB4]